MDPITQQTILASAGGKKDPLYVDDVFNTFLWTGTGSAQTITNGIDLAGEGGLVWSKNRYTSVSHLLNDSERGIESGSYYSELTSSTTGVNARFTPWGATAFNSNGFSLGGSNSQFNYSNNEYVSWTFRKARGFFDVVKYTGNNTAGRTVEHNLGSVPGMILVKCLDDTEGWHVYHRSIGATKYLLLNNSNSENSGSTVWNNTTPTSTHFTVSTNPATNGNGLNYVAYIFAHDDASFGTDGDESIIKCGSVSNNGGQVTDVNLGFEPQFIIIKNASVSEHWNMFDTMRGMYVKSNKLFPNRNVTEDIVGYEIVSPTATGFSLSTASAGDYANGDYIYMAIRRPNKPPEAGTDVFHAYYGTPLSASFITTGFPFDMQIKKEVNSASSHRLLTRKLGLNTFNSTGSHTKSLQPSGNDEAQLGNQSRSVRSTGHGVPTNDANNLMIYNTFKSAPGFMDVVAYTGNGTGGGNTPNSINHSLSAIPELIITKNTSNDGYLWLVYHSGLSSINSFLVLNSNGGEQTINKVWNSTVPTSTQFFLNLGENNYNNLSHIAFLFATLPGISKVGSYSGSSGSVNVDCGFTNGARFILIKRRDSSGDWYVWDYARGIVSGNDPYYKMNLGAAEITNTDYIDPLSSGFTVTSSAPAELNASGGTYIFLAIA